MSTSTYTIPDRIVPMRVIVCGVHRTGTLSIRNALWQLGFHDCYHMQTLFNNPTRAPEWVRAMEAKYADKGTFTRADWDRLLGNCQAVCDVPAAFFGPELAELYPEAKVIIMNRDPEKCDKEKAIAWYKAQYQEFHDRIPADRYIEYTITEGWGPLCEYLGVPVPEVQDPKTGKMVEAPFPHLNDGETFRRNSVVMKKKTMQRANQNLLAAVGRLALTGVVGYAGYLAWKTRLGGRV
ncbi:hypothetical protein FAGAP_11815 [Fusarium agapanthi]|uniref:P-loop containing nucleoside triphosphate hydrolase protein n=1 Tax=Fusarium agapanthi TaxID=1803897 RepID=A0A9P5B0P1_9HYPO|nr:hypothetical protein FAGAP_11815 [Fusarium agapanthi]